MKEMEQGELLFQSQPESHWLKALEQNDEGIPTPVLTVFAGSIAILLAGLKHKEPRIRVAAADSIAGMELKYAKTFGTAGGLILREEDMARAIEAGRRALPVLLEVVEDADQGVRDEAFRAVTYLTEILGEDARPAEPLLLRILKDKDAPLE